MRWILSIVAIAITAGCSTDEGTGPSPAESPVASIRVEGPETMTAPGYLAQEKMIVPTSGAQTAYLFTPSLDR